MKGARPGDGRIGGRKRLSDAEQSHGTCLVISGGPEPGEAGLISRRRIPRGRAGAEGAEGGQWVRAEPMREEYCYLSHFGNSHLDGAWERLANTLPSGQPVRSLRPPPPPAHAGLPARPLCAAGGRLGRTSTVGPPMTPRRTANAENNPMRTGARGRRRRQFSAGRIPLLGHLALLLRLHTDF